MPSTQYPLGIMQNNPAWLVDGNLPDRQIPRCNGISSYDNIDTGVQAFANKMHQIRLAIRSHTPRNLVNHLCDGKRFDRDAVMVQVAFRMNLTVMLMDCAPLDLAEPWPVFDFMRAYIAAINGRCPRAWSPSGEWVDPVALSDALVITGHWV